jgi:hypothetical protein
VSPFAWINFPILRTALLQAGAFVGDGPETRKGNRMQRLKKVWSDWMNWDMDPGIWLAHFSQGQKLFFLYSLMGIGGALMLRVGFDFRHSLLGKNHDYVSVWERIFSGLIVTGIGLILEVFTVRGIWEERKSLSSKFRRIWSGKA